VSIETAMSTAERVELRVRSAGWLQCRVAEFDEQDRRERRARRERTRGALDESFEVLVFAAPAALEAELARLQAEIATLNSSAPTQVLS
jgi:hypothetical protein